MYFSLCRTPRTEHSMIDGHMDINNVSDGDVQSVSARNMLEVFTIAYLTESY